MGGKPAPAVVDSQAVETVLDDSGADHAPGSAAASFLSAPPGDPAADALTGADDAHDIDKADNTNGTGGFRAMPGSGADSENLRADGEPSDPVGRHKDVTEASAAGALLPEVVIAPGRFTSQARQAAAAWSAPEAVTEIYTTHRDHLIGLAFVLVRDQQAAEEAVQDAFAEMHLAWHRLRDTKKALAYVRKSVVNKARSELRHRKVVETHAPKPEPDEQSAEHAALTLIDRHAVISALRGLPERQREAIVLRYYGCLSEADIAKAMGITKGAVKSHTARAMAALRVTLEQGME